MLDHNDVNNLEDMHCPRLLTLYKEYRLDNDVYSCCYHSTICALKNVMCLKKWCLSNKVL